MPSDSRARRAAPAEATGRQAAARLVCLLGVLATAAACGGAGAAPSDGARYQQITGSANAAWASFVTSARTWPNGAIPASGGALAEDVVRAWEQADRRLLAAAWPAADRADIEAMVHSDSRVCQVLEWLPTPGAVDTWWTNLIASFSAEQTAAGRVRLDLGLPTSVSPQGIAVPAGRAAP